MGHSLKRWHLAPCSSDRLTSLPEEVLTQILSLLPTKDAAATCVLNKKLFTRVFPCLTSVELEDLPISHCLDCLNQTERFPAFITFVNAVLLALSQSQHPLCRFRLHFGGDLESTFSSQAHRCTRPPRGCFPDLNAQLVSNWLAFPLARGIKELDLRIHMRNPAQLPQSLFACETLEVLKLDVNLDARQVCSIAAPSFCLPNLKVLHLLSMLITKDKFVTNLVSSCPVLHDLVLKCWWENPKRIAISSPSLRNLVLAIYKMEDDENNKLLSIDIPNLQSFKYIDNLFIQTSVRINPTALLKAEIDIGYILARGTHAASFSSMLNLITPMSKVQHLSLTGQSVEALHSDALNDLLPVFDNLKCLALGYDIGTTWDKVLLTILHHSPLLETLSFPEGLTHPKFDTDQAENGINEVERLFFRTCDENPSCCTSHLRRIVVERCCGSERKLNLIKLLLRKTPVLEELVICPRPRYPMDQESIDMLNQLPRASINCSIRVQ